MKRLPALVAAIICLACAHTVLASSEACTPPLADLQFSNGTKVGSIESGQVTETSGMAASRKNPNVLWVHNDSGDTARVFAMAVTGRNLGVYNLSGARAIDWEDIAPGPGPEPGVDYLYLGDIGDNFAIRSSVTVYRVKEPKVSANQPAATQNLKHFETIRLKYEDGPRDAEALMVDPRTGDLYVVSKPEKKSRLYRVPASELRNGRTATLHFLTELPWGGATAGDISPDGSRILVRGYKNASMWLRPDGCSVEEAFQWPGRDVTLVDERQGEAISFDAVGTGYYTTSEGAGSAIWHFEQIVSRK